MQGGVIAERWIGGIWIGLQFSSGEHIVALSDGRFLGAPAVHPRPETVKVTKEALNNIKVGPWHSSEVITQGSGGKPVPTAEETQPSQSEEPVPRSFRITQELLGKFGYSKRCPKCEALRRGDEHKTVHHRCECRKRLETAMNEDELLTKKWDEVEEKKSQYLARQVESADGDGATGLETDDYHPDGIVSWIECSKDEVVD